MFIEPKPEDLARHAPEFTVLHAPGCQADPDKDGTRSETFIVVNFGAREVLIGGSNYAGEVKKSVFSLMNYMLPDRGVMPMHASVNVGNDGACAIFFGLSGTGKTTLSADPHRTLVGDDEHGWSDDGVFNFEGGCYAKVIRLSEEAEPEIYDTTRRFGTILENVVFDPDTHALDLDDDAKTENTRASYPPGFHAQRLGNRDGRPAQRGGDADGGCVRRPATDRQAHAGSGDVPFPVRLHRPRGGDRARRDRARGHVLHLLRGAVHAPPPVRLRQAAGRATAEAGLRVLAGEYRAGPAAPMGSANACRSSTRGRCWRRPWTGA